VKEEEREEKWDRKAVGGRCKTERSFRKEWDKS
jgi:hypothetical protein